MTYKRNNKQMSKRKTLEKIAKNHLFIDTLETRNRDRLDFHEVSVWGVVKALEEAYELGRQTEQKRKGGVLEKAGKKVI